MEQNQYHKMIAGRQGKAGRKLSSGGPGLVPALEKAIAIIDYLNRAATHRAPLAELSSGLAITKSHCFSILKTLCHYDWLRYDERSRAYELHSGIIATASSVLRPALIDRVRPILTALASTTGFPCVVVQPLADASYVLIEKVEAPQSMAVWYPVGHRFPEDAVSVMRAYWAAQPDDRVESFLKAWQPKRYTGATLVSKVSVRAEIAATRARGYARSVGEYSDGVMVLSVPLFDSTGKVAYLLCCMGTTPALAAQESPVSGEMMSAAQEIHHITLGRPPAEFSRRLKPIRMTARNRVGDEKQVPNPRRAL